MASVEVLGGLRRVMRRSIEQVASPATPAEFARIQDISLRAAQVWFDGRRNPDIRYQQAAAQILTEVTQDVINNPRFYSDVEGLVHLRTIQLFASVVPNDREKRDKFRQTDTHTLLTNYLRNAITHGVSFTGNENLEDSLRLWSDLPYGYILEIGPQIGISVPQEKVAFAPNLVLFRESQKNQTGTIA